MLMRLSETRQIFSTFVIVYALFSLMITGCQKEPGSFSIVFESLNPPLQEGEQLYLYTWIEQRNPNSLDSPGLQISDSNLVPFDASAEVNFNSVPNRENLVVAVELKTAPRKSAEAKYYGESQPFTLSPEIHINVPVKLNLALGPAAPDTATAGKVTYHRIPNGSQSTNGQPSFLLEGTANAAEGNVWVVAYADEAMTQELGRTLTNPDGSFTAFSLGEKDHPLVYLASEYSVGRSSSPVLVRDVAWTGTVRKEMTNGGTTFSADSWFTQKEIPKWDIKTDVTTPNLSFHDGAILTTRGSGIWQKYSFEEAPQPRYGHKMAYDTVRDRIVLHGGLSHGDLNDTWEWDGTNWQEAYPATSPSELYQSAVAFDVAQGELVRFGGYNRATDISRHDMWKWNGTDWQLAQPAFSPEQRYSATMAYDATRRQIVLFGGTVVDGNGHERPIGDTWVWDGDNWTEAAVQQAPSPRKWTNMVYDSARSKTVLFGGYSAGGATSDTWEWDGTTWTEISPPVSPPPRFRHAMAYHKQWGKVIVFGGDSGISDATISSTLKDMWAWDGTTWTKIETPNAPPSRMSAGMAYNDTTGNLILFGGWHGEEMIGSGGQTYLGDTWRFDGQSWIQLFPTRKPSPRQNHEIVYNTVRQRAVLFGGQSGQGDNYLNDTWEWDGNNWDEHAVETSPEGRAAFAMANHPIKESSVIIAGGSTVSSLEPIINDSCDIWEWDGTQWIELQYENESTIPEARRDHVMVLDEQNHELLFTGVNTVVTDTSPDDNDTSAFSSNIRSSWRFDGETWQPLADGIPTQRQYHKMVFDSQRGQPFLFGGFSKIDGRPLSDTWTFNGSLWTQLFPQTAPSSRDSHTMVHDSTTGLTLLFGGDSTSSDDGLMNDTWVWRGSDWQQLFPEISPPPLVKSSSFYDTEHKRLLLFGGMTTGYGIGDMWEWHWSNTSRPAHVARFTAQLLDSGIDAKIKDAQVVWVGGGNGYNPATCESQSGASLSMWNGGRWVTLVSNTADASSVEMMQTTISKNALKKNLNENGVFSLRLALTPAVANGCAGLYATVSSDYLEATVHYQLAYQDENATVPVETAVEEIEIPEGVFMMGCNAETDRACLSEASPRPDEMPYHEIFLDSFFIDKHAVTVAAYRTCVAAGGCKRQPYVNEMGCNYGEGDAYDTHPVNCVDWYQANAYCTWVNKRLPTEAEWEKAARGSDGRVYPWGHPPVVTCLRAALEYPEQLDCSATGTVSVCAMSPHGDSELGICDLTGNTSDWCADWYANDYYRNSPHDNPYGATDGVKRIHKGGGWADTADNARISYRGTAEPSRYSPGIGFRCARSAQTSGNPEMPMD